VALPAHQSTLQAATHSNLASTNVCLSRCRVLGKSVCNTHVLVHEVILPRVMQQAAHVYWREPIAGHEEGGVTRHACTIRRQDSDCQIKKLCARGKLLISKVNLNFSSQQFMTCVLGSDERTTRTVDRQEPRAAASVPLITVLAALTILESFPRV